MSDHCRTPGCGAEVIFVPSATTGRSVILDAKPKKGVVLIDRTMTMHMLIGLADSPADYSTQAIVVDVYTDHHATCPGAKEWQGRTRKQPPVRSIAQGIER